MKICKVITWQAPSGEKIEVTKAQEKIAREMGKWPRTTRGEEYCTVSHGLHRGTPTFNIDDWAGLLSRKGELT